MKKPTVVDLTERYPLKYGKVTLTRFVSTDVVAGYVAQINAIRAVPGYGTDVWLTTLLWPVIYDLTQRAEAYVTSAEERKALKKDKRDPRRAPYT